MQYIVSNLPMKINVQRFGIDNNRNFIAKFFAIWQNEGKNGGLAVFDRIIIRDKKGRTVEKEPNEIITQENNSVSYTVGNALSVLSYNELTVELHFIVSVGSDVGYSLTLSYFSDTQFRYFKNINIGTKEVTEEEVSRFAKILSEWKSTKSQPSACEHESKADSNSEEEEKKGFIPELDGYIKAVYREMNFLRQEGGKEYKVTNGRFIKRFEAKYVYCFDLEAELYLADDSPLTLKTGTRRISGSVSFCENFMIIVTLEEPIDSDLKAVIPSAFISSEPWKLLDSMNNRLYSIDNRNTIALKLLREGPQLAFDGKVSEIQTGHEAAIAHALSNPITVIWGPPGTGKTYTMAKLAGEYVRWGKSILIVSHSNISVDNVVKQIYTQFTNSDLQGKVYSSKILRYGYVRDEELQKNPYAVSFNVAIRNSPYKTQYEELSDKQSKLLRENEFVHDLKVIGEIKSIEDQLKRIRVMFKGEEKALVASAVVVGTTVSKIYADPLFEDKKYDVVMFDEVSMAYVPQVICAASFAESHLVCVGDFRQLAPIVQSDAKTLLGNDLFEFLGICSGFSNIHPHPWMFMLDEQRRMHPDISCFPSRYVYRGLLKDHSSVQSKWSRIVDCEPFSGNAMTLINLYTTCCAASKNEDNSRFNILSAVVSLGTALKAETAQSDYAEFSSEEKVGIITPYAAQTRLIRAMIQDYRKSCDSAVSCATVHQFQGSERNIVIFDAVESYPAAKAGWLMSKNEGGSVTRLINVALTRARGKFITVTNKVFWQNKFESSHAFYSLVLHMNENDNVIEYKDRRLADYISSLDCGKFIRLFSDEEKCVNLILEEISKARKEVTLLLPQGTLHPEYGYTILDAICSASLNGKNATICRDKNASIPDEYDRICLLSESVTMPLLFIDNVVWYGVPVLQYSFTEKITTYKVVTSVAIRFSGVQTVEMIRSLVERTGSRKTFAGDFALYVKNNSNCICGGPYKLSRGRSGFYLSCFKCGKNAPLSTDLVDSYLNTVCGGKCPLCGCDSYARIGQYGCYVTCANKHNRNLTEI